MDLLSVRCTQFLQFQHSFQFKKQLLLFMKKSLMVISLFALLIQTSCQIYVVFFEIFENEKTKAVLEYNTYGSKFLAELIHVFDDDNNFSNGMFLRYKHRKDDKMLKLGMKINGGKNEASKKLLVKALQTAIKKQLIKIRN